MSCLVGSLGWAAFNAFAALTDPEIRRRAEATAGSAGPALAVVALASLPLALVGLSVWLLLDYRRGSLTIRGDRVIERGVIGSKEFDLREVVRAQWRTMPTGGSLELRGGQGRVWINFASYGVEARDRIVRHLRAALPPEVQEGWDRFAHLIGTGEPRPVRVKPGPGEVLIRRDRWDRVVLPLTAVVALGGVAAWWITGRPEFLATPAAPLGGWLLLRAATPAAGMIARKISSPEDPDTGRFLGFLLTWGLVAIGGLMGLEAARRRLAYPDAAMVVGGGAWLVVLLYEAGSLDRRRARRVREAADLAAKAQGETDPWPVEA